MSAGDSRRRCTAAFRVGQCPLWVIRDQGGQSHATVYVRFAPKADMHELTAICLQNREKSARPPVNLLPVDSAATPVPTGCHPGARGRDTRLTTGFLRWRPRRSHLLE